MMMVLDGVDDGSQHCGSSKYFHIIFFYDRCFKRSHCYEKENSAPLLMVIKKMTLKCERIVVVCMYNKYGEKKN